MVKRAVAAYLWVMACWSLGAVLEDAIGVSEYVGLVVGIVMAIAILAMPTRFWTGRVIRISTPRASVVRPPTGLTAAD